MDSFCDRLGENDLGSGSLPLVPGSEEIAHIPTHKFKAETQDDERATFQLGDHLGA